MPRAWDAFFTPEAEELLKKGIALALEEDGPELTSRAIFTAADRLEGVIRAKEKTFVAGLPIIPLVMEQLGAPYKARFLVEEGSEVGSMTEVAVIESAAEALLKAERVILNYITHLSGVANLAARYARELEGTGVRLLDTRKTLPGLRWVEKYAVQLGGGLNHRMNLAEMLMLKDNHIDAAGSITGACARLRASYDPCPPIEVECRTIDDVRESLACGVDRIMLDNMPEERLREALAIIPDNVEAEISGGATLENIRSLALANPGKANFISVGRLTHSAQAADFSMVVAKAESGEDGR